MKIEKVRSEGISALSYFVSSKGEAFVIDPRRDAEIYVQLAERHNCQIQFIFETHRNEDLVTGSLELQSHVSSARIGHSDMTNFKFGDDNLADDESFSIGDMTVTCIQTPGHTDDSMCFVISDTGVSSDPLIVFTGDTLFVGEVGRTDLVDPKKTELMAEKLYSSIHDKVLPLGDGVIMYPAHGAGSVCGGDIGEREFSTLGYERRNNNLLNLDVSEFVEKKTKQNLTLAPYFKNCEKLNTIGPPLIRDLPVPKYLDVDSFANMMKEPNHVAIDTRPAYIFRQFFVPMSISLDLDHMGLFAPWVLDSKQEFLFILNQIDDFSRARGLFLRVGLDNVIGYLGSGIESWVKANKPIKSMQQYSLSELKDDLQSSKVEILDVRQPHEFSASRIPNSILIPLTEISNHQLNKDKKYVTMCPAGVRSTTGASILLNRGIKDVLVPLEGLNTWIKRGYPIESKVFLA